MFVLSGGFKTTVSFLVVGEKLPSLMLIYNSFLIKAMYTNARIHMIADDFLFMGVY